MLRLWLLCKLCWALSGLELKIFVFCACCTVLLVFVFVFHSCFIQKYKHLLIFFFAVDKFLISFFSFASQNLAFRTYLLYFSLSAQSKKKFKITKKRKIVKKPTNSGKSELSVLSVVTEMLSITLFRHFILFFVYNEIKL